MDATLRTRNANLTPALADVATTANTAVADNARNGRPKLVALAFDANRHYSYVVADHPVNDTPWDDAA